jgi:PAS domain S-box-containing protein
MEHSSVRGTDGAQPRDAPPPELAPPSGPDDPEIDVASLDADTRQRIAQRLAQVGTWEWTLASGENVWSDEVWALYGLDPRAAPASYALWLSSVDPRDQAACAERVRAASERGESFEMLWRTSPALGSMRWLMSRGHPLRGRDGRVARYLGIVMDVTERKRAEEALASERAQLAHTVELRTRELADKERELEQMLDAIPGVVGYWDRALVNHYANRAYLHWFGWHPSAVRGRTLPELLGPEVFALNRPHVEAALRGEPQFFERDLPLPDGRGVRTMQAYYVPDARGGEVRGFYVLGFDVTERKRAEAAAEAASRAKTDFLARMSHEIRTPLHAVLGLAQLGQQSGHDAGCRDTFARITAAGRHLLELVNSVLDFSRIEAGKLTLQLGDTDVAELEEHVLSIVRERAADKGLALFLEESDDLPPSFRGDALRIEQVLLNLLANAVSYTERGRVTLRLARDEDTLVMVVEDTGVGMDEGTLAHAFEPFERGHSVRTEQAGTGLGLAIALGLVEQMRGTLRAHSTPGYGTTMTVRLPVTFTTGGAMYPSLSPLLLVGVRAEQGPPLAAQLTRLGVAVQVEERLPPLPRELGALVVADDALAAPEPALVEEWLAGCGSVVVVRGGGAQGVCPSVPESLASRVSMLHAPITPLRLLRAARRAPRTRSQPPRERAPRLVGVRVLAAEDNAVNRLVLTEMLKVEGAECVCAEHGGIALELLAQRGCAAFDIVLCDIEMPVMDGYQTARALARAAPQLPVIGVTAHAFEGARDASAAAGMVDFVAKPYLLDDLVSAIRRHLPGAV